MASVSNQFASAVITTDAWQSELDACCQRLRDGLDGQIDLLVMFVSSHFQSELEHIVECLHRQLSPRHMIGGTGEGVIADAQEFEGTPAISLWCASLPQSQIDSMRLTFERTPDGSTFTGWLESLDGQASGISPSDNQWEDDAVILLVGEPFSFPVEGLLQRLEEDRPGVPVVGGMASGFQVPGENRIVVGPDVFDSGAAVVVLQGSVKTWKVVSQGCRPIGPRFVITAADQNLITGLGGKPALDELKHLYQELPTREQAAMQQGFHIGRVVSEYQDEYLMGDFLIRNVVGVEPDEQAVVIADYFRVGQTVQFHIRDQQSASQELTQLLSRLETDAAGALLFTCNGRGQRLFEVESHDAAAVRQHLGALPVSGFFAQGELGPVGGKNFLHGFTASIIVFES